MGTTSLAKRNQGQRHYGAKMGKHRARACADGRFFRFFWAHRVFWDKSSNQD